MAIYPAANARAACASNGASPPVYTCSGASTITTPVGNGIFEQPMAIATVAPGATVNSGNSSAISLGDNATITIGNNAVVTNSAINGQDTYLDGANVVDFNNNSLLTIEPGASITATGFSGQAEAVNPFGANDTIDNYGTLSAVNAVTIWFQDGVGMNTVINEASGVMQSSETGIVNGYADNILGSYGAQNINFINKGALIGNLGFGGGNDVYNVYTGATVTGVVDGGGGTNAMTLNTDGANGGADTMSGNLLNFSSLTNNSGIWTITGALGDNGGTTPLAVTVAGGTMVLTGDNTGFNGIMSILAPGTLALGNGGTSGDITGQIADGGTLAFNRSDIFTFANQISGTGAVVQQGAGTTILTANNTYTGGTTISGGTLALGNGGTSGSVLGNIADNATLAFNRSDVSTISGLISGTGAVVQQGAGTTILTANNTYTGGTTISGGTLQLGNGGTTGSVTGAIVDNATLAFNRSDTVNVADPITGTGGVLQSGSGTTILTGTNTFTGPTKVTNGILVVGDPTHPNTSLADKQVSITSNSILGGFGSVAGSVVNNGLVAVGNALPMFSTAQDPTIYVGGNFINAGTVTLAGGAPGNKLEVSGNYIGDNGVLVLDTYLGGDNSPSDQLVLNGGTASGTTAIQIINVGGRGAATHADGIQVVAAINGATTSPTAFHLAAPVSAGLYEYNLYYGGLGQDANNQSFYLRTTGLAPAVQTSLPYTAILTNYADATLGTLQQRTGNRIWAGDGRTTVDGLGAWARAGGQYAQYAPNSGTRYNQGIGYIQGGSEGVVTQNNAGVLAIGGFATFGASTANLDLTANPMTGAARKGLITTTGYGVGANLTWLGVNGFYVDGVGQFTWYDSHLSNKSGANQGYGTALSVETGKRVGIAQGWALIPQVQLVYTNTNFDSFTDSAGNRVQVGKGDSLQGRAGMRVEKLADLAQPGQMPRRLQVYGIANLTYEMLAPTGISVANAIVPTTTLAQGQAALWGELGAGATYAWKQWSVYAQVDYASAVSARAGHADAVSGSAGLRYIW